MAKLPRLVSVSSFVVLASACFAQKQLLNVVRPGSVGPTCPISDCKLSSVCDFDYLSFLGFSYKRPGRTVYGNINFRICPGQDEDCDDMIDSMLHSVDDRRSMSVIFMDDPVTRAASKYSLSDCFPVSWTSPGGDITGKVSVLAKMSVVFTRASASKTPIVWPKSSTIAPQKTWLPSNFRLRIDGLDVACHRVTSFDGITVKQGNADLDGDGRLDFVCSDFSMELPVDATDECRAWIAAGGSRQCIIDYLASDGSNLRSLVCTSLTPLEITERSATTYTFRCAISGPMSWIRESPSK
jgi:hypothetical protein